MEPVVYAVIMAGGRGTRFWPLSTAGRPKQFLDLTGRGSMLRLTVERVLPLVPPSRILVVTGADFRDRVAAELPMLPPGCVMPEPLQRNTAACIGWAARRIASEAGEDALMLVLPSDHLVSDDGAFRECLRAAMRPASEGWLVTLGVVPDRPATGYGYLEAGEDMGGFVTVARFVEKPDSASAEVLCSSGRHYWNAGIFAWRAGTILEQIRIHIPALAEGLEAIGPDPGADGYGALPSVSIDYGVMEKASRVAMVPAGFGWDDLGDWPAARRAGISSGDVMMVDSADCTVWAPGRLAVLLGVSGISVVESGGVLLVMADARAQALRDVVAGLSRERPELV